MKANRGEAVFQDAYSLSLGGHRAGKQGNRVSQRARKALCSLQVKNGDTEKQLLARSRYLLFKNEHNWTPSQVHRAEILFNKYPTLEKAYKLSRELAHIYQTSKLKGVALQGWPSGMIKSKRQGSNHSVPLQKLSKTTT
ncbi:transposase [Marinoscillum sp.]|uniref:transposase n=1 Tax=Marinoscillum sp. TaxID=2024838 RepID=UPI003BAD3131